LENTFEGGTSGTTVSTSNSAAPGDTQFTAIGSGTGTSIAFDNSTSAHGSLSAKVSTGSSVQASYAAWNLSGSQLWFRGYFYFTAFPASSFRLVEWVATSTYCGSVNVNSSGVIALDGSAGTDVLTTTNTIPLNQWFRLEGFLTGSATVGQLSVSLYEQVDGTTATETQTTAASVNTASASITSVRFGINPGVASIGPFWMDDLALSSTGAAGPYPYGWTLIYGEGNTAVSPHAYVAAYWLVAAGSDSIPAFTCTLTGTGAMTATLYEITQYDTTGTTGWFDSYGIYASG
jgi:hypothetical protein